MKNEVRPYTVTTVTSKGPLELHFEAPSSKVAFDTA